VTASLIFDDTELIQTALARLPPDVQAVFYAAALSIAGFFVSAAFRWCGTILVSEASGTDSLLKPQELPDVLLEEEQKQWLSSLQQKDEVVVLSIRLILRYDGG
jgi:hypothetical protein